VGRQRAPRASSTVTAQAGLDHPSLRCVMCLGDRGSWMWSRPPPFGGGRLHAGERPCLAGGGRRAVRNLRCPSLSQQTLWRTCCRVIRYAVRPASPHPDDYMLKPLETSTPIPPQICSAPLQSRPGCQRRVDLRLMVSFHPQGRPRLHLYITLPKALSRCSRPPKCTPRQLFERRKFARATAPPLLHIPTA